MDAAAAATKRRVNSIFPVFWTVESSESRHFTHGHFQAAMICHNGHCRPVRLEKDVLPAVEVKKAAWNDDPIEESAGKMRGYPQNASTLTPCRHNESLGNGTRKIGMAALCKR